MHTIYPPVAEAAFTAARLASLGRSDGPFPLQVMAALGSLAVRCCWPAGRLRGRPAWSVALWAWCPVTAVELANNGHIDWLAALASAAALIAYRRGRPALAGGLLGAAIATKLYPALLLPALLRRHPVRVVVAASAWSALSYLPHVLAVGTGVIGYLPGYLKEEDYTNGGRFLLLAKLVPHPALTAAAVLVLLAGGALGDPVPIRNDRSTGRGGAGRGRAAGGHPVLQLVRGVAAGAGGDDRLGSSGCRW